MLLLFCWIISQLGSSLNDKLLNYQKIMKAMRKAYILTIEIIVDRGFQVFCILKIATLQGKPFYLLFWDRVLKCTQAAFNFVYLRMILNFRFLCLHLPSSRITGMCLHTQFYADPTQGFTLAGKHSTNWAVSPVTTGKTFLA